jgi:hypothetical protein
VQAFLEEFPVGGRILSWCDKLASTPAVGFKLDHHFAPAEAIASAFTPVLDKLVTGDTQKFNINQNFNPLAFSFTTDDGFQYSIDSSKVSITFNHRLRAKLVSGKSPIVEMLSAPKPFTKLLPEVSRKVVEATLLVPGYSTRKLWRVGIITTTSVAEGDVPPGIDVFLDYLKRPWSKTDFFNIQIASQIDEVRDWSDRCIHHIVKSDDPEQLLTLSFDWQRSFTSGKELTSGPRCPAPQTNDEAGRAATSPAWACWS